MPVLSSAIVQLSMTRSASNLLACDLLGPERDGRPSADDQAVLQGDHPSADLGRDRVAAGPDQAVLEPGGRPVGRRNERPDPRGRSARPPGDESRSSTPTSGAVAPGSRNRQCWMASRPSSTMDPMHWTAHAIRRRTQVRQGQVASLQLDHRPASRLRLGHERRHRTSSIPRSTHPGWRSKAYRGAGSGWSGGPRHPLTRIVARRVPSTSLSARYRPRSPDQDGSCTSKVRFQRPPPGSVSGESVGPGQAARPGQAGRPAASRPSAAVRSR